MNSTERPCLREPMAVLVAVLLGSTIPIGCRGESLPSSIRATIPSELGAETEPHEVQSAPPAPRPVCEAEAAWQAAAWDGRGVGWVAGANGLVATVSLDRDVHVRRIAGDVDFIGIGQSGDESLWLAGRLGERFRSTDNGQSWALVSGARGVDPLSHISPSPSASGRLWRSPRAMVVASLGRQSWLLTDVIEAIEGQTLMRYGPPQLFIPPRTATASSMAGFDAIVLVGGGSSADHMSAASGSSAMTITHRGFVLRVSSEDIHRVPAEGTIFRGVFIGADGYGVVVGGDGGTPVSNHRVLSTADFGRTWTPSSRSTVGGEPPSGPADLCDPDEREHVLRCTWNAGRTWYGRTYPGAVPNYRSNPDGRVVIARSFEEVLAATHDGRIYWADGSSWRELSLACRP